MANSMLVSNWSQQPSLSGTQVSVPGIGLVVGHNAKCKYYIEPVVEPRLGRTEPYHEKSQLV